MSNPDNHHAVNRFFPWIVGLWLIAYWLIFFTSEMPNGSGITPGLNRSTILLLLPEIYSALIPTSDQPGHGLQFLSQRCLPLAIAGLIVAAAFAAGRLFLRGVRLPRNTDPLAMHAIAGGIGLSIISLFTLATGLLGWMWSWLYLGVFGGLVALEMCLTLTFRQRNAGDFLGAPMESIPSQNAKKTTARNSEKRGSTKTRKNSRGKSSDQFAAHTGLKWACLSVCLVFGVLMVSGALLPQTDFDVKEYHLGGPKEYFQLGQIRFLPHNVYTSFPFLTEMLILAGMVVRGDWEQGALAGQAVLACFAFVTALGVAAVARQIVEKQLAANAGWIAAAIYMSIPWTYRISVIAYTEGALCCYAILVVLAYFLWCRDAQLTARLNDGNKRETSVSMLSSMIVLGVLAGNAISTKYTGLVQVAIPCGVAVVLSAWRIHRQSIRSQLLTVSAFCLGVLIAFGPWLLKNLFETGNPVYPLAYSLFGGIDWNQELQRKWQDAHPLLMFKPGWYETKGILYFNDWQSVLIFGFAPFSVLLKPRKTVYVAVIAAMILFVSWYLFTHRLDRFWVPMNSIMAVLASLGMIVVWMRSRSLSSDETVIASEQARSDSEPSDNERELLIRRTLVTVLTVTALVYNFGYVTTSYCGYNAYLSDYAQAWKNTTTRSVAIVESQNLPPESKVLFVGEAELFNARFPYAYSTVFDQNLLEVWTADQSQDHTWTLKSIDAMREKFALEGVSYVFVNWNEILRYRTTYRYTDYVTPGRLRELESLGLLEEVRLGPDQQLRPWDSVDPQWQDEVKKWAPELQTSFGGQSALIQFQMYRVIQLSDPLRVIGE